MKTRWPVIISVALNLALLAAIAGNWRPVVTTAPVASSQPKVRGSVTSPSAVKPVSAQAQILQTNIAAFNWSQVASADFKSYRDQLLAMGCPEKTMRVILLSEINEHYGQQLKAALAHLHARFWDLIVEGPSELESKCREATGSITEERKKVIDEVLGKEKPDEAEMAEDKARSLEVRRARYSWLSEDKRDRLIALEDKLNEANDQMRRTAREKSPNGKPTDEQVAQFETLKMQVTNERKQILTPEEFEEYELRSSNAAHWANIAVGFEPTEDEWRAVARLQKERDDEAAKLKSPKTATEAEKVARASELQRLTDQLAEARTAALGTERAALYDRGIDRDYQQVREVIQRYGLEDEVANQVYELQREAMKQANALRKDSLIDPSVRDETLAAIQQETERTLEQTMGSKAFSTYQKYDNGWFDRLGRQ